LEQFHPHVRRGENPLGHQYLADTQTATAGADDADFGHLQATIAF
jgi:hypothetical protein